MKLTPFRRRTLEALAAHRFEGLLHEKLYPIMFPNGRFNKERDYGSSKGGPSGVQCAVNWHLGKFGELVRRQRHDRGLGWEITGAGLEALKLDESKTKGGH